MPDRRGAFHLSERPLRNKQAATGFLEAASSGRAQARADLFTPGAKHHNAHFPAGIPALLAAMDDNARQFPKKVYRVVNAVADVEMVAVHGHVVLKPGDSGISVVHLFRFEGEKVAELWDVGQPIPADSPNKDGAL